MRIAVLGVGLIGGSVALAARQRLGAHVVGWDPSPAALSDAFLVGAIDETVDDFEELEGIDLWVVAAPVREVEGLVRAVGTVVEADAIVTDVASIKRSIVEAIDFPEFIGGHPLAGSEAAGVRNARADLFEGATWYLTPKLGSPGDKYERLHNFVASLGAVPTAIYYEEHDHVMAAVSHLPHVLANVLVGQAHAALGGEALPATGGSFRDATRVAGANPPLWAQIYSENAQALGAQLDEVLAVLADVREHLGDLEAWQREAGEQRRELLEAVARGGPLAELRVLVPNRPGVVADLALTLGGAGINISDMSLAPAFDNLGGTVTLWISVGDAERARQLVAGKGLTFE